MSLKHDITLAALGAQQHTNATTRVIRTGSSRFSEYCRGEGLNKKAKIEAAGPKQVIQGYADHLIKIGYSPSTIHTYLYGPCKAFGVPMSEIKKPRRVSSAITRSRDENANPLGRIETGKSEFSRLVEFQEHVGIRRSELAKLTGASLVTDESGHPCVSVVGGKGGKDQLQRILPKDETYVKSFFASIRNDQYVFNSTELRNHIDLHGMRADHAREAYDYYAGLAMRDKDVLIKELCARWLACHPDKDTHSPEYRRWYGQMEKGGGVYKLRGDNYDRAVKNGRPTSYDRVALMATSVYHLSHWRLGVTVTNYLV